MKKPIIIVLAAGIVLTSTHEDHCIADPALPICAYALQPETPEHDNQRLPLATIQATQGTANTSPQGISTRMT